MPKIKKNIQTNTKGNQKLRYKVFSKMYVDSAHVLPLLLSKIKNYTTNFPDMYVDFAHVLPLVLYRPQQYLHCPHYTCTICIDHITISQNMQLNFLVLWSVLFQQLPYTHVLHNCWHYSLLIFFESLISDSYFCGSTATNLMILEASSLS